MQYVSVHVYNSILMNDPHLAALNQFKAQLRLPCQAQDSEVQVASSVHHNYW